jgi:hypothetical protein
MRTIKALKYDDGNTLDFATNEDQRRAFREMAAAIAHETGEAWEENLSEVEVEQDEEDGTIIYNESRYAPTTTPHGNGFYVIVR